MPGQIQNPRSSPIISHSTTSLLLMNRELACSLFRASEGGSLKCFILHHPLKRSSAHYVAANIFARGFRIRRPVCCAVAPAAIQLPESARSLRFQSSSRRRPHRLCAICSSERRSLMSDRWPDELSQPDPNRHMLLRISRREVALDAVLGRRGSRWRCRGGLDGSWSMVSGPRDEWRASLCPTEKLLTKRGM